MLEDREIWAEKYRASNFFDLMTLENTNRDILQWLKSWDEIVFPEKFEATKMQQIKKEKGLAERYGDAASAQKPVHFQMTGGESGGVAGGNNNYVNRNNYWQNYEESLTFKKYRMILISGPPGIGKSTLARVLARHCGYAV